MPTSCTIRIPHIAHLLCLLTIMIVGLVGINTSFAHAQANEKQYANVRGWQVIATYDGSRFAFCGAITSDAVAGMDEMQIAFDGRGWRIGRNDATVNQYTGRVFVGNYNATLNFTRGRTTWIAANLDFQLVAEIRRAHNLLIEDYAGNRISYSLAGSSAALAKVEECVRNAGNRPVYNTRRQQQPNYIQPNQRRNNTYIQTQKTTLSGIWVWADRVKNSKNNKIVSTIEMRGANNANYCYGFICWDVVLQRQGNNAVSFSTDGINHFEMWETGVNQISGRFWENFNNRGAPDATVNMR